MIKEEFNTLSVKEQIEYFIDELREVRETGKGKFFNDICKDLGISKNTIRKNFAKAGYVPTHKGNTNIITGFILQSDIIEDIAITEDTEKVTNKDSDVLKEVLKRLETLEREVSEIKGSNNTVRNDFVVKSFETDRLINKAYKLDIEVIKELEKIFEKYSTYKKQDIINTLLLSAIDNIK